MRVAVIAGVLAVAALCVSCEGREVGPPGSVGEDTPKVDRQAEAQRYAPMVWLADGDEDHPMDADEFIDESELWFHENCSPNPDRPRTTKIAADVAAPKLAGRDGGYPYDGCAGSYESHEDFTAASGMGYYLDLADAARHGTERTAPTYWEFHERRDENGTVVAQAYVYWLFYGYNNFANNHEGDWERVAVQIKDGRPAGVTFWKHHAEPCLVPWPELEQVDGHPVTYSAGGSHGSYHQVGTFDAFGDYTARDVTSKGRKWATWGAAKPVVRQPWWGYRGLWGQTGAFKDTSGPHGPYLKRDLGDVFATAPCDAPAKTDPTPVPPSPQERPRVPEAFHGLWSSPKPVRQPSSSVSYYVQITLWGEDETVEDGVVGLVEYSDDWNLSAGESKLTCSAELRLTESGETKIVLSATEKDDLVGNCVDQFTFTLTLSGDRMTYSAEGGGVTATATLDRK